MKKETFGPTLPVMKVADEVEVIRLANDSVYASQLCKVWRDTPTFSATCDTDIPSLITANTP